MDSIEAEMIYEEKADQITQNLEELILNAMLNVLKKINEREELFSSLQKSTNNDDMKF